MESDERTIDQSRVNAENSNVVANETQKTNPWKQVAVGGASGIMLGAAGAFGFEAAANKADNQVNVANRDNMADNQIEDSQANNGAAISNASESGNQPEVDNNEVANQTTLNDNNTQHLNTEAQVPHDDVLASTETAVHLDVPVAEVDQDMSFAVAFTSAREQVGPGGVFEWHDGVYSTYTPGEWDSMSQDAKNEYYDRVNITGNSTQNTDIPVSESEPAIESEPVSESEPSSDHEPEPVDVNINYYEVNETIEVNGSQISEEQTSQEEHVNNTGDTQSHEPPTEINVNYYEVNRTIEVNDPQPSEEQTSQEENIVNNNIQEENVQQDNSNLSSHVGHDLLDIAEVDDSMSFADAFAEARSQVGPGGMFEWHGKYYGTYTRSEWNSMSHAEKHAYNENVIATKHELDSSGNISDHDINVAENNHIEQTHDDNHISTMEHGLLDVANVDDSMSYADAFAEAREQVGPGGIFEWHGKYYGTYTGSEWNSMSQADKRVYYENVAATKADQATFVGDGDYEESSLNEDVALDETSGEDIDNMVVSVDDVINDDGTTSRITYAVVDGRETILKDGVAMVDAEDDNDEDNYYEEGGDEDEIHDDGYYEEGGDEDEIHDDDDDTDDGYEDDYSEVGDDYGSDYDDGVSDMASDDNFIDI